MAPPAEPRVQMTAVSARKSQDIPHDVLGPEINGDMMSFVQWAPGTQNVAPTVGQPVAAALGPSQTTDEPEGSPADRTCKKCGRIFTRPSALFTHMNTHTGKRPHECGAPGCNSAFAARSNMLRHRRTHGEEVVAALEERERREAAARPPPPAVFSTPIVNEQVGGGGNGDAPVNVQWMTPNRASRAYRRYPDVIPQVEANVVTPVAPGTTSFAPVYWQGAGPQQDGQNSPDSSYRWA
ncbi:hypothetical protein K525DRAFT_252548 [Schizophyllum commune Loenen D]|nr:hypothetical protein K525DRAFT_252548 [Schizophyllum commune Loenen D]